MRAVSSIAAVAFGLVPAVAMAQEDLPKWAAGCQGMVATYRSQAGLDAAAVQKSEEAAVFWRDTLERAEADPAKREALVADAQKALDGDLTGKSASERTRILMTAFSTCVSLRGFVGGQQEAGEVKP